MEHKTQRTMAKKVFRILFMLLIAVFGIYLAIQFIIIFHRGYKTETTASACRALFRLTPSGWMAAEIWAISSRTASV